MVFSQALATTLAPAAAPVAANPMGIALAEYVTSAGPAASSSGWVSHIRDATQLSEKQLESIYRHAPGKQQSKFISSLIFAPPSVEAEANKMGIQ